MSKRKLYRNLSKKDLYDEKSQNTRMNLIAFSDSFLTKDPFFSSFKNI